MKKAFDKNKYIKKQTEEILKRMDQFDHKLYLEFGGKLFDDHHASRILPGFDSDTKIQLLQQFKEDLEIIIVINASDIEKHKVRADYGITYDIEVIRLIDKLKELDLLINSVVITQYKGQVSAEKFQKKLERNNIKTYIHTLTKGYPTDVNIIVSEEGYGANAYIETTKPLVVVTAPGPNSGKLATCLSQLYHENKRGITAGYAKFETFPVWNLSLKHPVNIAYESATADLSDRNMIDYFHLEEYGKYTVNYNRDVEAFPVLKSILEKIQGKSIYHSPTDMGVNMIKEGIIDDELCKRASKKEILRRFYNAICSYKEGHVEEQTPQRIKVLMNELAIDDSERKVIETARKKTEKENFPSFAIELNNGDVVVGRETNLMTAPASCFVNAIKQLAGISDEIFLLSPQVLEPVIKLKSEIYGEKSAKLNIQDVLLGLSILETTNPMANLALKQTKKLKGTDSHSTYIPSPTDRSTLRNLEINMTSEAEFYLNQLYQEN